MILLVNKILAAMTVRNYEIARGAGEVNIVYLEGANADGTPNGNTPDQFNDRRIVISHREDGTPYIAGNWDATTEPGRKYTLDPLNPRGAARIAFGQHKAWTVGTHRPSSKSGHEALVQREPVAIYRDLNEDFSRKGDILTMEMAGINQHHGYGYPRTEIHGASAGCLVGRVVEEHRLFMDLCKADPRYRGSMGFLFHTVVMPVEWITQVVQST